MKYKFEETTIKFPAHDMDINFILPNGELGCLQWRVENETLDFCFQNNKAVYVQNGDLKNGKRRKDGSIIGKQITILE